MNDATRRTDKALPPSTPYSSALEHLDDRIAHVNDLVAAYAARMAAEEASREGSRRRRELLLRAQKRSAAEVPEEVTEIWELADRRLAMLREREALTAGTGLDLPLVEIERRLGLSEVEVEALVLAVAPLVDPTYFSEWETRCREAIALDVRTATAVLTRSFSQAVKLRRIFARDAPLVENSVILLDLRRGRSESDFLNLDIEVPRRVVSLVLADAGKVDETSAFSCVQRPTVGLEQVVLAPETISLVRGVIEHHAEFVTTRQRWGLDDAIGYGRGTLLLFVGEPGVGKTMLAQAIARELGKQLFVVDAVKLVAEAGRSVEGMLEAVFREALLLDTVLFFDEAEQIFAGRQHGNELMSVLLTRLERFEGVGILATNMVDMLDPALFRRMLATLRFERPTATQRAEIWHRHLPPALPLAADVDVNDLAERYELTGGLIKNAVLVAVHAVVARGGTEVDHADLEHGARAQLTSAFPIQTGDVQRPEITLDDLVFSPIVTERVARFVQAARVRTTVLQEWGMRRALGGQAGAVALLRGPSGTGKSALAEAVARELDRPLLRCRLAEVISRYVGDTARQVRGLFDQARAQRAVLVFDEADALFTRRTAVHSANDRFANAETDTLLAELDRHDGVVILTTNHAAELDPAFERRFFLTLTLDPPAYEERLRIWQNLLGCDAPLASDVNVARLAADYLLTGAQIRNAVFHAALAAAAAPAGSRIISHAALATAAREQRGEAAMPIVASAVGSA